MIQSNTKKEYATLGSYRLGTTLGKGTYAKQDHPENKIPLIRFLGWRSHIVNIPKDITPSRSLRKRESSLAHSFYVKKFKLWSLSSIKMSHSLSSLMNQFHMSRRMVRNTRSLLLWWNTSKMVNFLTSLRSQKKDSLKLSQELCSGLSSKVNNFLLKLISYIFFSCRGHSWPRDCS